MSDDAETGPDRTRQALDAVTYALAVTAAAFLFALGVSALAVPADIVSGVVLVTFLLGWAAVGYATLLVYPSAPWSVDRGEGSVEIGNGGRKRRAGGSREQTRFQAAVQRLPPVRWYPLAPDERLPTGIKLFVSAAAILAGSYLLETAVIA